MKKIFLSPIGLGIVFVLITIAIAVSFLWVPRLQPASPLVVQETEHPFAAMPLEAVDIFYQLYIDWQQFSLKAQPLESIGKIPNAVPFLDSTAAVITPKGKQGIIILVIDDMGVNRALSKQVLALPAPLTLAYLPYADALTAQTQQAKQAGHTVMLHMPMEPLNEAINPGAGAVYVEMSAAIIYQKMQQALARIPEAVAVNNHMGSRFTADATAMRPVMQVLAEKGLFFLDSRTNPQSVAVRVGREYKVPVVSRDVFLDHVDEIQAIQQQLAVLEKTAQQQGVAIAIGHPRNNTIAALKAWLPTIQAKGLTIKPITALVRSTTTSLDH